MTIKNLLFTLMYGAVSFQGVLWGMDQSIDLEVSFDSSFFTSESDNDQDELDIQPVKGLNVSLNSSFDSSFSMSESVDDQEELETQSANIKPVKCLNVGFNSSFEFFNNDANVLLKKPKKSPRAQAIESFSKLSRSPLPFKKGQGATAKAELIKFIKSINNKKAYPKDLYDILSERLLQFSMADRSALLNELIQEEGVISHSKLLGLVWANNEMLPEEYQVSRAVLPVPNCLDGDLREHITSPIVLKGSGKLTGYHLKQETQSGTVSPIFSGQANTYAGTWKNGTREKCSTFFPATWNFEYITLSIESIFQKPLARALSTTPLSLSGRATPAERWEFDALDDEPCAVQIMRFLGYGKDSVLLEFIFNIKEGYLATAYPILYIIDFPSEETNWECTINKKNYCWSAINGAVREALADVKKIRYTDPLIVDIAQTSLINPGNLLPADFSGVYIKLMPSSATPVTQSTSSSLIN